MGCIENCHDGAGDPGVEFLRKGVNDRGENWSRQIVKDKRGTVLESTRLMGANS